MPLRLIVWSVLLGWSLGAFAAKVEPLTKKALDDLIKLTDDRQSNTGDYKSLCYVKENEKDKEPKVYQLIVFRRDADDKFMLLFTKPKQDAGKGYLKIDKNLWNYDPGTGKWERRTAREHIGGTNSREGDFDDSKLAKNYNAEFVGGDKLGDFNVYKVKLTVKPNTDVAYPVLVLEFDVDSKNILKREEYALSGKLMRTTFYPKWEKKFSKSKNDFVWIPAEMRIFDELEKGNSTVVLIKETSLDPLEVNIFTKAWVESKSR